MTKNPAKDFGPIADDYAFFEAHSTEAEQDARAHVESLTGLVPAAGPLRFLDFGCGSGSFTTRFLQKTGWPPARLWLTLIEPAESQRRRAVTRLAAYTEHPVVDVAALPGGAVGSFDIVLANHVLYYVPQLRAQLAELIRALSPAGVFVTAIAPRTNALVEFWLAGFRLLGKEAPYNTSEDVEAALQQLGTGFEKQQVTYQVEFPDTEENRTRILRFLLAEHLEQMPRRPLLDMFDRYANSGLIRILTASDQFKIRSKVNLNS
jgi:trans-aconitate 2-methyltransferase